MNKEISVQYAYKKDGKGERHGDQAERMLAAQARKHNVQPTTQALPAALFSGGAPHAAPTILDMENSRAGGIPQHNTPGFMNGRAPLSGGFSAMSSIQTPRPAPSPQPLPAPPSGLPARPPPSQAGYGGPQGFLPPGFTPQQPQGFPPSSAPPLGFAPPTGLGPPPGQGPPPGMPPGFQPQGFTRAR